MGERLVSSEADRVREHSSSEATREVDARTRQRVGHAAAAGDEAIAARLDELAAEWDIEQWLQTNAAILALVGVGLAALFDTRWFLLLPLVVLGFLLQHAIQGWCPPVVLFRRLGVRTQQEIDAERYALKALRGDFRRVEGDAGRALDAAQV
jgi:hypothetical protein